MSVPARLRFAACLAGGLFLLAGRAVAHIPLTLEILTDAFAGLDRAQSAIELSDDSAERAAAIYEFALQATGLMELLNQEIMLHGLGQQELLDQAVANAAKLGVEITWSDDHQRYFYRGEAYKRYLELVPRGLEAAKSLYHLVETGFYLGSAEDRDELEDRVRLERDFLQQYPNVGTTAQVAMFLAIDSRDLYRLCRAKADADCAERYANLHRDHLVATAERYAGQKTGEMAATLLERFEAELSGAE